MQETFADMNWDLINCSLSVSSSKMSLAILRFAVKAWLLA